MLSRFCLFNNMQSFDFTHIPGSGSPNHMECITRRTLILTAPLMLLARVPQYIRRRYH